MANPIVREKLAQKQFFVAPGLPDMIAAVVANKVGFEIVYGSGYWLTASASGLPDAGIATYTQMLDRMATLEDEPRGCHRRRRHRLWRPSQRAPHREGL